MSQLANTAISTDCGKDKAQRKDTRDHFPDIVKMVFFYRTSAEKHLHISCYASAHHLMCKRTTAVVRPEELILPAITPISSSNFHYISQRLLLFLPGTFPISFDNYPYIIRQLSLYLSITSPISLDDYPYIPQRLLLYLPASASVSAFQRFTCFFLHQFSLIYDF